MKPSVSMFSGLLAACFMLLAGATLYSQENAEQDLLQVKANELVFSNPDESIKIANHLLKKTQSDENKTVLNLLLTRGYITKGDYNKSLEYLFEAGRNSKGVNDSLVAEVLLVKAEVSRKVHLFKQAGDYLNDTNALFDKLAPITYKSLQIRLALEKALIAIELQQYKKALEILAARKSDEVSIQKSIAYTKATALLGTGDNKAAENEFNKALKLYRSLNKPNIVFESRVKMGLSKAYLPAHQNQIAIDLLLPLLERAVAINNIPLQEDIHYQLAAHYLALNNKIMYQQNYDKFLTLNTQAMNLDNEAVNSLFNLIGEEQESDYLSELTNLKIYTYSAIGVLVLIIVAGTLLYIANKSRKRRLKEIMGYLEVTNNLLVKSYTIDKKEPSKKITISTETEQVILAKLRKFEVSTKYTSKDMSLGTLSAQLDVNTKYLSEIINKHYNDNFNTYINRLRINYIIEKLKNEPEYLNYKISYLAEESGFSSHSSFATVFKSITGIAPTVFIDLIGKEVNQKKA